MVDTVKPLIEQGGLILTEANGVIRGLDPDGRIQANAKHKTAAREATPEEYRLAEVLKELAGNVSQTIDNAKKKIAGMPHAKKELNPLWNLLAGKSSQSISVTLRPGGNWPVHIEANWISKSYRQILWYKSSDSLQFCGIFDHENSHLAAA